MKAKVRNRWLLASAVVGLFVGVTVFIGDVYPFRGEPTSLYDTDQVKSEYDRIDWDRVPNSIEVTSEAEAEHHVPFELAFPSLAAGSQLRSIQVTDPDRSLRDTREVFLIYDHVDVGRIMLRERRTNQRPSDIRSFLRGGARLVQVKGSPVLVIEGFGLGRAMWIRDGVFFDLAGPELRTVEALDIVAEMLGSAD